MYKIETKEGTDMNLEDYSYIYILALGVNKVYTMRKKELKGVK